jgi:CheY-like chemotaxis protein
MRAAERGQQLTQQLLTFSRRQMLRPEIVDVNRLLREFETLLHRAVDESVTFSLVLDSGIDPCRLDPAHFQSAVLNLVMNARDATPAGGRIVIETYNRLAESGVRDRNIDLAPGRYVVVSVSDSGSGMTEEVRSQAFDPFFTTKEVGKGSGLGLSQVYGFAKQSGGHVMVESEPGHGTSVRLYLPSANGSMETRRKASTAEPRHAARPVTVLIVEDDETVLTTVEATLTALNYRTLMARDAAAALAILRRGEPVNLLFTDIVMPGGMNGVELACAAQQIRPDIKVLLTSGYAAQAIEDPRATNFPVLSKPYRQAQLADMIATILDQR